MIRIPGQAADMVHVVLVDLVDGHVEADIVCSCIADIMENCVVGIAPDCIVTLPVAIQAQKDKVGLRKIDRESTVGDHVDNQEAHLFSFDYKIPECLFTIPPEESLATAEEQNTHTQFIERLHLLANLLVRVYHSGDVIDRAVLALEVTFIGDDNRSEDWILLAEQDCFYAKAGKVDK